MLFLPLQHLLLPDTDSDYSFCDISAIVLCPSSVWKLWLLLLCYVCHCIMSFFCLQILITPFDLFLPLQHLLLPNTDSDYSFCVIFAIVLCPSSVYRLWLLLLCYFCHCSISFFRLQILITPFVLFLPLYYVLLPFTHSDYSFWLIFAIAASPSSGYRFWLLLLCYFCHCIMSFFCLQILITPFVLFLPLQHLLLPVTDSDYSFCVSFAIVLCPSSVSTFWLLLLCYFCHCIMSFFRFHILITPFVLFLPLYYVLLPFTNYNYSFCDILPLYYVLLLFIDPVYSFSVIFAIAASPSSEYRFWLLLLSYFCHCIMSFFRLQIMITPFVLVLPLYYVLLPFPHSDYSFCVIFAIVLCPSSVYTFWLLLLTYFCHCSISFFRIQILITPFVLFLPLYYVLLLFTDSDYSFCVIFATAASPSSGYRFWLFLLCYFCHCIMSFFRLQIMITPFVLVLPLYYVLLPFPHSDYSFCVIFAIVLCPSSVNRFWLLLLCYFCHCIMSFFRLQIMITPFVLFLPLYYVLLPFTHSDYSFCVMFAIVLCPSSVYKLWLLLLCYFCHCIMSFFRLQIMITPFVLFLPLYYVLLRLHILITHFDLFLLLQHLLLPDTDSDYSFCVIFAIVLCPSSVYRFWLLLLCYFCYCSISFFRIQIPITPLCYFCHCIMSFFCLQILITLFELFLPLQHLLLPGTDFDYSFCVIFAIVLCPSSVYRSCLLLLCYFCHYSISFFRIQILITPFVLLLPLYYVLLPDTDSNYSFCDILPLYYVLLLFIDPVYSFCVIFAIAASPSSGYRFWLLLLWYFCHCIMSFFRLKIMVTPFVLCLPLYYVLLLFTDSDYSFWLIFAIAASPSSEYRFWLLLLCYFCHCIMSFFCLQIMITPFVLFLPLQHLLLPVTDSDYSFCVIFAIVLCPSSVYTFWLLLLTYFCHCSISFFRIQILITPFVLFLQLYYVLLLFTDSDYSFCVIFATAASPSSGYRFWLLLLC